MASASATLSSDSSSDDEPVPKKSLTVEDYERIQQQQHLEVVSTNREIEPSANCTTSTGSTDGPSGVATLIPTADAPCRQFQDISDCTSMSSISISSDSDEVSDDVDTDHVDVEFEVGSVSICSGNPIEDANSSSECAEDEEAPLSDWIHIGINKAEHDADGELELDTSDDEVSTKDAELSCVSDRQLSDKSFWKCFQCNTQKESPYLRYCIPCFRIRRDWLPKRPQPKGGGKRKTECNSSQNRPNPSSVEEPGHTSDNGHRSEENSALDININRTPEPDVDKKDKDNNESQVCSVCMVRNKDAAFIHGKTAHVYSCYHCSDQILKKSGKCPLCRKRILRVVKLINS